MPVSTRPVKQVAILVSATSLIAGGNALAVDCTVKEYERYRDLARNSETRAELERRRAEISGFILAVKAAETKSRSDFVECKSKSQEQYPGLVDNCYERIMRPLEAEKRAATICAAEADKIGDALTTNAPPPKKRKP
jgi:hypothetical protein